MSAKFRSNSIRVIAIILLSYAFTMLARGQSDTVAYYDFSGGLDGWTSADLSQASTGDDWVWTQFGPQGDFPIPAIQSTTQTGGYLLFDSDALCSGSQNARIQSPVFDFTGDTMVEVRWQQLYRRYENAIYLEVSRDSGRTFAAIELSPTLLNDDFSGNPGENPHVVRQDISAIAAGQPEVMIAFRYYSEPDVFGAEAGCGYAWMIDDVAIANAELPPVQHDLAIRFGTHSGAPNLQTPRTQVGPLALGAQIINHGAQTNEGVLYVAISDVTDPLNPQVVHQDSTAIPALRSGQVSSYLLASGDFIPPNRVASYRGEYHLRIDGQADEQPGNNSAFFAFEVTASAFAKTPQPEIYIRPQAKESWAFGNVYEINHDGKTQIDSIYFWLRPEGNFVNSPSDSVVVHFYDLAGDLNSSGVYDASEISLIHREAYSLGALLTQGQFKVAPLSDAPLELPAGVTKLAVLLEYHDELAGDGRWVEIGGIEDDAFVNYDAEALIASLAGISRDYGMFLNETGELQVGNFPGFVPSIQLVADSVAVVDSRDQASFSVEMAVWPNPTAEVLNINLPQSEFAADYQVRIYDLLGRMVLETRKAAENGVTTSQVDLRTILYGQYLLEISSGQGHYMTRKIAIAK